MAEDGSTPSWQIGRALMPVENGDDGGRLSSFSVRAREPLEVVENCRWRDDCANHDELVGTAIRNVKVPGYGHGHAQPHWD
jgi:hypothetical protein